MKLHLPKSLFVAVLAAVCMGGAQAALTVTEADGTTTISNDAGWSKEYSSSDIYAPASDSLYVSDFPEAKKSATILWDCGLGYDGASFTNIGNSGDIIVGGSGQLYLQTWNKGAISMENDLYLGSTTFAGENGKAVNAAMRLSEASGDIYLGGNVTLVEDALIWMQGSDNTNTVTFAKGISGSDYKLTTVGMTRTIFGGTVTLKELDTRIQDGTQATQTSITLAGVTDIDTLNVTNDTVITVDAESASTTFDNIYISDGKSLTFDGTNVEEGKKVSIVVNGEINAKWNGTSGTTKLIIDEQVEVTASELTNNPGLEATINGKLTLNGGGLHLIAGGETDVINGTGILSTSKLGVNNWGTYTFRGGLRLEIGTGGIGITTKNPNVKDSSTIVFEDITIAATKSWTDAVTKGIQLGSSTGTTFEIAGDQTVILNGILSDKQDTQGKLVKTGLGELVLGAANTYSGGTSIQAGTLKVSGSGTLGSGPVEVQENGTLHIAGTDAAKNGDWIVNTTGAGNILVSTDASLNAGDTSKATGNLKIQNATLKMNIGRDNSINLSKFTSWTLDNAIVQYHGAAVELNDVTVTSNGAEIQIQDMKSNDAFITLKGTTTLKGGLSVKLKNINGASAAWKGGMTFESLTGDGNLDITSGTQSDKTIINIQSLSNYYGDITITKATGPAILNLSGSLNAGKADNATTITAASGAVINVGGGTVATTTSGKIGFASAINVLSTITNTGDLTLGRVNVNSASNLTSIPVGGSLSYSNGTDGFIAQEYYVVKDSSGTLTADNLEQYTFGGVALDASLGRYYISNNSLILSLQGAGDYYVNTQVKAGGADASTGTANATGYVINNGGKLTVDGALASGVVNGIRVADGAAAEITLLNQTLNHSQTVTMGDGATVSYILDKTTLNLSGLGHITNVTGLDLRNGSLVELHSTNSKLGTKENKVQVKLSGGSAISLQNSASKGNDVWADIEIDGAGEIRGTTYGDDKTSVQGTIKGSGTLSLKEDADSHDNSYIVASAISDKNAEEHLKVVVNIGNKGVTLSGNNSYSGGTEIKAGKLTTSHESALGTGTVSVNGGMLQMAADLSLSAMDLLAGSVNNGGHQLNVSGVLRVGEGQELAAPATGGMNVGTLQLDEGASATMGAGLTVSNLSLASGSKVTMGSALTMGSGAAPASAAGDAVSTGYTLSLEKGITLKLQDDLLNQLNNLTASSEPLVLITGVNTLQLGEQTYTVGSQVLTDAKSVSLTDYITIEGFEQYYVGFDTMTGSVIAGLNVPEPTTATLGLLALAGLCARRRRK